tara:strand:- start:208 stop:858 length:651 start_codon:yes stop_codon:yes gene_type:complete
MKPENPNELTLDRAIDLFIDAMCVNWERLDRHEWRLQMKKLMKATFLKAEPASIKKSIWYVLQNLTSSFPPSQGEIIAAIDKISVSGKVRLVKHGDCEKCDSGRRISVFWLREQETGRHVKHSAALSCDCEYGLAQKKRLKLENISVFVAKMQNHPRLIDDRIWFQTQKGERPSLEIEKYDMNEFRKFVPEGASDFRKKFQHILLQIAEAQEKNDQ